MTARLDDLRHPRRSLAIHEAGHAVAYVIYGAGIKHISIDSELRPGLAGFVQGWADDSEPSPLEAKVLPELDPAEKLADATMRTVAAVAGVNAERIFGFTRALSGTDADKARAYASTVTTTDEERDAFVDSCEARARGLFRYAECWLAVINLAAALIERTTLDGTEAEWIIKQAMCTPRILEMRATLNDPGIGVSANTINPQE